MVFGSLGSLGAKIARLLGEPERLEEGIKTVGFEDLFSGSSIAQILPYKSYDPTTGLFFSNQSVGFIIEAIPFVGADLADQVEISNIFGSF